jgi:hypothetical protein
MVYHITIWQRVLHLLVMFALIGNIILPISPASLSQELPQQNTTLLPKSDNNQQFNPVLSVQPSSQMLLVGSYFTVTVQLSGLTSPLNAFQFDLNYDNTLVQPLNVVVNEQYLEGTGRTVVCPNPDQSTPTTIRVACASSGALAGPLADGALATITFWALDVGTTSLTLSEVLLPGEGAPPTLLTPTLQEGFVSVIPQAGVTLGPEETLAGLPGTAVTHHITITNSGTYTDTFSVTVMGNTWPTVPAMNSVGPLAAGQSATVPIIVNIPNLLTDEQVIGSDTFMVTAVSGWNATVSSSVQRTTLAEIVPAVVFAGNSYAVGTLDTTVTHVFELINQGNYTDTFALALSGYSWPTDAPDTIGPLGAGQTLPVTVTVAVPEMLGQTILHSDTFTLTASSTWDVEIAASALGTTDAVASPAALLSGPQTGSGPIGGQVVYMLSLTNAGDFTDTFTLTTSANTWPVVLSIAQATLAAEASVSFYLTVTIPAETTLAAQDVTRVTAVSQLDQSVQAELEITTTVAQTGYNIYLPILLRLHTIGQTQPATQTAGSAVFDPLLPSVANNTVNEWGGNRPFSDLMAAVNEGCFITDMNCDQNVNEADLLLVASSWNCAANESCYEARADLDGNGLVDVVDLAWVGNDYDISPPELVITVPQEGQIVGGTMVEVAGLLTDTHDVFTVTVNGMAAAVSGNDFQVTVPVTIGTQVLNVVATNNLGQVNVASRLIGVDGEGPMITVHQPENRQAVYTFQPAVVISYTDFYTAVNPATLNVTLTDPNGLPIDVTNDLIVDEVGASGVVNTSLSDDTSYTMTVSLADVLGNNATMQTTFYVPANAVTITPPPEPEGAGYISGVIYDSSTCDEYLTTCKGLAGVMVTLESVDTEALNQVREARVNELATLDYQQPLAPMLVTMATTPISGTIITGPDGFFVFPVDETGVYWLRAEKEGFTYGQREAEIVREHSTPTNAIYLTPLDTAVTPCDGTGCFHTNSDGSIEIYIPPGAIPTGEIIDVNATNFDQVEFLPSGELPPETWETYAFNLGGDSEITFTMPITVRIANTLEFTPGTPIPLGYWNQATQQWEHAGTGIVDASGLWVELQVTHFSNYDCNDPVSPIPGGINFQGSSPSNDDDQTCPAGTGACFINFQTGEFEETISLPSVSILGEDVSPQLIYSSNRANPTEVLDFDLSVTSWSGQLGSHIGFELYIEGLRTDSFTFSVNPQTIGEVGRFRYLWDGRNAEGILLPEGIYQYKAKFSIPYRGEYCYALGHWLQVKQFCELSSQ